MPRQQAKKSRPQQLDLFQVQVEYPKEIVRNQSQEIDLDSLDLSKNVLICNVKKDNVAKHTVPIVLPTLLRP